VKRVAVGLSGGVDSAVAASLLKREGYDVIGVTMKIWDGRPLPVETARHACYGPGEDEDVADAERIARSLQIPFHVVDLAEEYNETILEFCSRQYLSGVTPNPCVHCNRRVKFERIPAQLRSRGVAVDYFATGHYAGITYDESSARYLLRKGADREKDQSYFLYLLTQEQLATTLFPVGAYTKGEIRRMAGALDLPVAEKPESQDFVAGGYRALFGGAVNPGPILDEQGAVLGEHQGIHRYTIGQRRGLGIARGTPLYVIAIDQERNAVVVGPVERLYSSGLVAGSVNWIAIDALAAPRRVRARIRYRHEEAPAVIAPASDGRVAVSFEAPQRAVTPGQAVVFYDGDTVVGGGTIEETGPASHPTRPTDAG
jgi:tRNA-specific 2-thiouridylase